MTVRVCILLIIAGVVSVGKLAAQNAPVDASPQPTLLSAPSPVYPKSARDAGIGGKINVRVVVDESGAIVSVDNVTGPDRLCASSQNDPRVAALRDSVVEALKQAKFSAAVKDGKPVKAVIYLASTFDPADETADETSPINARRVIRDNAIVKKALSMPKPAYPASARPVRAAGPVSVRIVVDESGNVFSAEAIDGHPLLRNAAVAAACQAKFNPTMVAQRRVLATGTITYFFVY